MGSNMNRELPTKVSLDNPLKRNSVILNCVKSVKIRSFFWSVFGHFSRSVYLWASAAVTAQKMKFSIKDFFSKCDHHCGKSVHIWSCSGPYFPTFGLNTNLSAFSPNAGKCGPE